MQLNGFTMPLRVRGLWIEDARGNSVCECVSSAVADDLLDYIAKLQKDNAKLKDKLNDASWKADYDRGMSPY